jgi:hypothetical protein
MINMEQAEQLKSKRFLFAHMSVGENIIEGLEKIKSWYRMLTDFQILSLEMRRKKIVPAFYHIKLGSNGDPEIKCKKFINILDKHYPEYNFDIVLFKFCYVDINRKTDVASIFKVYQNMVDQINKQYPDLRMIHITCPLTAHYRTVKQRIRGYLFGDQANINRNFYNQLIHDAYGDKDQIFDLADAESAIQGNKRAVFEYKNEHYNYLAKTNTNDGRHLNEKGKVQAAGEIIQTLSTALVN